MVASRPLPVPLTPLLRRTYWPLATLCLAVYSILVSFEATCPFAKTWLALVPPAMAVGCAPVAIRATTGRVRSGWILLGAAMATWLLADGLFSYALATSGEPPPFPSSADAFYLAGYALMTAGLVAVLGLPSWRTDWHWLLDAAILTISAGSVLLVILPIVSASGGLAATTVGGMYPLWDVALLAVLVAAAYPGRPPFTRSLFGLCVAISVLIVADLTYLYWSAQGSNEYPVHLEVAWLVAYFGFARAFLDAAGDRVLKVRPAIADRCRRLVSVAPYLAVIPPLTLAGTRYMVDNQEYAIVAASWLIVSLVLLRLHVTHRANSRLAQGLQAENQLREQLLRAQSDLGQATLVLEDGRAIDANGAAEALTGRSRETILALPSALLLLTRDQRRTFRGALDPEGTARSSIARRGESPIDVELAWKRLDGTPVRTLVMLTDLRTRQAELAARVRAEKAQSVGVLAGGIAHDFNNLLTAVTSNASLALREAGPGASIAPMLEDIQDAAARAGELARSLLAYAGREAIEPRPVDFNAVVGQMVRLARSAMPPGTTLAVSLDPAMPAVMGDEAAIGQILMNLVVNAGEALATSGSTVTVETRMLPPGEAPHAGVPAARETRALLVVRDDGPGMDQETVLRIFDPFFSTKPGGRGLGLASVHGIVSSHNGAITVDSRPGAGTTFSVTLPVAEAASAPAAARTEAPAEPWRISGTAIVADDNLPVRTATARVLEMLGMDVLLASNGVEAVQLAEQHPHASLAVLDVVMPLMSGPEAFGRIRALRPDVPILLVSGYDEDNAARTVINQPHAAFLGKPYRVEQLASAVRSITTPVAPIAS